jgi:tetratricopeptide (TPR) repeat protein
MKRTRPLSELPPRVAGFFDSAADTAEATAAAAAAAASNDDDNDDNDGDGDDDGKKHARPPEERARACRDKGNALAEAGRMSDALRCFQEGLRCVPTDHLLLELSAQAYLALDRPLEACKAADAAAKLAPAWADGQLTLARAQRELGEVEAAVASYRVAVSLDGGLDEARTELLELEQVLARLLQQKALLEEAVKNSNTAGEAEANTAILHLANRFRVG